jgi:hypothetical protein
MDELNQSLIKYDLSVESSSSQVKSHIGLSNAIILEQAAIGRVYSVETISLEGKHNILGFTAQHKLLKDITITLAFGFPDCPPNLIKTECFIRSSLDALGIINGITHTEIAIGDDGSIEIIEVNPRFAGVDILEIINSSYDINIQDALFAFSTGQQLNLDFISSKKNYSLVVYVMLQENQDVFNSLTYPENIANFTKLIKEEGYKPKEQLEMHQYLAAFGFSDVEKLSCYKKMSDFLKCVKVNEMLIVEDANNLINMAV